LNSAFTPEKYLAKAERALRAAQLLSQAGEIEGACNRAYYAMYDAAHAALLAQNRVDYKTTKTHSGLIAAFGLQFVSTDKISRELGRAFNEVEQLRLLADYTGEEITSEQVSSAIKKAEAFVTAIQKMLSQSD
jgi:uncharacterized protein (UPF0332 family)